MQDTTSSHLADTKELSKDGKDSTDVHSGISQNASQETRSKSSKLSCKSQFAAWSIIRPIKEMISDLQKWSGSAIRPTEKSYSAEDTELDDCDPPKPIIRKRA